MNPYHDWKSGEKRRKRGPAEAKEQSVKNVLQSWFDSHDIVADFNQEEVVAAWEELTGTLIKKLTKRVYVKDKVLYVYVNSPALRTELMMIRGDLCERLNQKLGGKPIRNINIK